MPISSIVSQFLVSKARRFGKQITAINQEYSGRLVEIFSGIRLVKATGTEQQEYEQLKTLIRDREQTEFRSRMASLAIAPITEVTSIIALFTLVVLGRLLFGSQLEALSAVLLTYSVFHSNKGVWGLRPHAGA